jgi:hypothetical protein
VISRKSVIYDILTATDRILALLFDRTNREIEKAWIRFCKTRRLAVNDTHRFQQCRAPAPPFRSVPRRREPDSNPRSHPTALVAAHIPGDNPFRRPDALQQLRSPTASYRSNPIGVIVGSGYIVRELSLFPSRFVQRDPHPQVGPGVRIRFPPAASPQTLGPSAQQHLSCWAPSHATSAR